MLNKILELLPFILWGTLWLAGGGLMAVGAFRLPRRFAWVAGLALGAVTQVWIANLLGAFLPVQAAFFGGASLTLALGLVFAWPLDLDKLRRALLPDSWQQVIAFLVLAYTFTAIGRGLGLFEEYQNLPTISLLARGDIPPQFALDPKLRFGYHYLMLLFAAQVTRLGGLVPWVALDLTRGLFFALTILLTYLWVARMTRSRVAALAGAFFAAFASGTRWLLLLLPAGWVANLSKDISLLGSSTQAVQTLENGLTLPWNVDGGPPQPFPFAYINGINMPHILDHGGAAMMVAMQLILILLVYRFWRDWRGGVTMAILLAALANLSEHAYLVAVIGMGLALLIHWIRSRSWRIPPDLRPWIAAGAASAFFAAVQGGVLTELVRGLLGLTTGAADEGSYFTVGFALNPRPTVISGHLGLLNLTDPRQLLLALIEIGPVLIAAPITFVWAWKMIKAHRWWEAALIFGGLTGLGTLFLRYEGSAGVTATSRLFGDFLTPLGLYFVPLLWTWARSRAARLQQVLLSVGAVTVFGGLMLFGMELIGAQKPVTPLQPMDVQIYDEYWDKLEPDALVFDMLPARAVTIFGRYTDSNVTWYVPKESWIALARNPLPVSLRAAGFDYFYYSLEDWENFTPAVQASLNEACVKLVTEASGIRSDTDFRKSWRRLVGIRSCQ